MSLLILASTSPRRKELLERAGVPFETHAPRTEETARPGEHAADQVERLAREKALAVANRLPSGAPRFVLGADTVVVLGARILGKPRDASHAESLLGSLAGRAHRVWTGVAIVSPAPRSVRSFRVESEVVMHPANPREIADYVRTGEPLDKAGAYAAQGLGRRFIERIEGSESNVIGLPVAETLAALRASGFTWGEA